MHQYQRTYLDFKKNAEALADAIEKQQIATRSIGLWQALREKARDRYIRLYFEGQLDLSILRALHHTLVAQSCQMAGYGLILQEPANGTALSKANESSNTPHPKEWNAHDTKAAALSLLGECCRRLGMENRAHSYDVRARQEGAMARVLKTYDKKLQDPRVGAHAGKEPGDLHCAFRRLECAARNLESYNLAYAKAMAHVRVIRELEKTIDNLETGSPIQNPAQHTRADQAIHQRDIAARLAEKEALAAVSSYENFQMEIQLAQKEYDRLTCSPTDIPLDSTNTIDVKAPNEGANPSVMQNEAKSDLEKSGSSASGTESTKTKTSELDSHEPALPDSNQVTGANQSVRNLATGVVVGQVLREIDRGM